MKKLVALTIALVMVISLCPVTLVMADETDLYARQIANIPYYSNGQIKFKQTEFGKSFVLDGETWYDADGTNRMKRLTASNQNEIWKLMLEPSYLEDGWKFSSSLTADQFANGEVYAQLDLGGATPIDEAQITYLTAANIAHDKNYAIGKIPKIYRFDASDDGVTYTPVKTVINDLSAYKDTIATKEAYVEAVTSDPAMYDLLHTHKVVFDQTVTCRYLRFVMIQPTQDWVWNDGAGDRTTTIGNYQLFTYSTWKDIENESDTSIAVKDANGIYQFARVGSSDKGRNTIGFSGEEGLATKEASRVTFKDETIGRDWNLDEGAIQSSWGNFALSTNNYANYTDENVYLQYDFGYPERVDVIEQSFRNTEDATKVNDIPKTVRIDYGAKNEKGITEWTKGPVFTTDMSDPASVGAEKAAAYNNYLANGTLTNGEKMVLNQAVKYELAQPITARFFRIVYLQPTQNGSLPTENKLKIKKTTLADLSGLTDANKLAAGAEVPFNEDGSVNFTYTSDDNIRYAGEDGNSYPVSRIKASQYINWKDWYYRHLVSRDNNSWVGLQGSPANFKNGNIWLEFDFGAEIDVDSFLIDFKTFRYGNAGDKFLYKAEQYDSLPSKVRIDYGSIDDSDKLVWTEGKVFEYTLDSYDYLKQYTKDQLVAANNTAEADRTAEQQQMVDAVNAIPTEATYDLGYKNVRFLRYVLLDPMQSGIENNTSSTFTWYFYSTTVYGAQPEVVTSATITAATENSIEYAVTLAEADKDAVIFAALYKGEDLVAVKRVTAEDTSVTFDNGGADTAKILVWESVATLKPLANAELPIK